MKGERSKGHFHPPGVVYCCTSAEEDLKPRYVVVVVASLANEPAAKIVP